jgi:hypothetical protein
LFTQERYGTIVDPLGSLNNLAEKSLSRSEHLKKHLQRSTGKRTHCCSDWEEIHLIRH